MNVTIKNHLTGDDMHVVFGIADNDPNPTRVAVKLLVDQNASLEGAAAKFSPDQLIRATCRAFHCTVCGAFAFLDQPVSVAPKHCDTFMVPVSGFEDPARTAN